MEIAIIAHDLKKELMTQFCIAYCGILSKHNLCATNITAKYISEATGLEIEKLLAGVQGGKQQIASRVSCNEVDGVEVGRKQLKGCGLLNRILEQIKRY